jgi:hypothetical protein
MEGTCFVHNFDHNAVAAIAAAAAAAAAHSVFSTVGDQERGPNLTKPQGFVLESSPIHNPVFIFQLWQ